MRKYNPNLKSMVDNYRAEAAKYNLRTDFLTDEQVFNLVERAGVASTGEEQLVWFLSNLDDIQPPTEPPIEQ